jgi:hypothetical protein
MHKTTQKIHRTTQKLGRVRALPRFYGFYPCICLTTEEKARKNLTQDKKNSVRLITCMQVAKVRNHKCNYSFEHIERSH